LRQLIGAIPQMSKWQQIKKIILYVSAPLAFLCAPTVVVLAISYTRHSPRSPRPETGNVVPFNDHGTYIYITHLQDVLLNSLFAVGFVAGFITVVLLVLSRKSRAR